MDQPILIVRSVPPTQVAPSGKDTLKQIENLLEEEITQIRDKLDSGIEVVLNEYFTEFNLHFQTDKEVVSIVLESEWQEQVEADSFGLPEDDIEGDSLIDLNVSQLMRAIKITYSKNEAPAQVRKKVLAWIIAQADEIPFLGGLGSCDYLLLPAKSIVSSINNLRNHLSIE